MGKIISVELPQDLPENWTDTQYVSPGGVEVGLTEKHGYNYLMRQVNAVQEAVMELDGGVSESGFGLGERSGRLATDMNNTISGGFYEFDPSTRNSPSQYGVLLMLPGSSEGVGLAEHTTQIVIDHQLKMFIRNYDNGSWSSWVQVGTTAVVPASVE